MNNFIHRARIICKKQLLTLALACAMLISAAPVQAMALEEGQTEPTVTAVPADTRAPDGNWGFEHGDLSGWTVLTPGWGTDEQGRSAGVVSAVSEGEYEMPTNQSGSWHLSGLHNGVPGFEGWAVRSPGFVLSGSGWISVKMGGAAAAVKVFLADGTQVGYYRQSRYKNVNYPYLSQGGSWNDMAVYAIDLSGYLGKEMYLVLCDEVTGGDAYAVFDDVVTSYAAAPDAGAMFDTVADGHKPRADAPEVRIPWVIAKNEYRPCTENSVQNGGFESGDLTGWTVLTKGFDASSAVVNELTYWAQELPYNQSGSYHLNGWNTGIPEAEGWAVRSSAFVLGGSGFISVKMGGNAAAAKVFLADGTQVGYYRNFRFHDTNFPYISKGGAWCDMATYVIDLSDYLGKEMYIELHDEVITDGWANAFFDDVVTYYETAPDASKRSDKAPDGHNPGDSPRLTYIPWVSVPKTSTEYANQIPNGDFETGDLSGWTIYGSGFPIKNGLPAADSSSTYWDQELPFNKSGNYFVNGSALSGNEASTWRLRSTPFTLGGSGWISVKMGGHAAAVRVYKLDGTLVGDFDQSRFCDKDFPYLSKDGSWNDMATYLLDLTQNIGDVLYIELCDDPIVGGWANAFFDDVVTYYETVPTGRDEEVKDGHQPGEKAKTVTIHPVVGMNNLYSPRNGGFEMGNLTGWTLVEGWMRLNIAVLPIKDYNIDADTTGDDFIDEFRKLPYNTSGNFIISGHDATGDEAVTWTLRSSPFTLAGSGYISVKMGGSSAAFRVRTVKDEKIIAHCDQRRFNDDSTIFPYISKGGCWRDMAVYVMDLSEYLGETLVIELMDQEVSTTWADAYFDDVIGYYAQRPTTKADTVIDGYKEGIDEPKEIEIPWIYVDEFEDFRGQWPTTANLTGFTVNLVPDKIITVYPDVREDPDGPPPAGGEEVNCTIVNLYGLLGVDNGYFQLDEGKMTITRVTYCDLDGNASNVLGDYSKFFAKEGCYAVEYTFEQVGHTQTGNFSIVVEPSEGSNGILNGSFETGNLAGWTPLTDGVNTSGAVTSAKTYWDENLPYNQEGNYHLGGIEAQTGIPESAKWAVKSSTFTLNPEGSGYITWRMGGHGAALTVHMADSGKEIARVEASLFHDDGFPNVSVGHWLDMTTYVLDLSEFFGDELYIVLHDELENSWGYACFDEIKTDLPEKPKPGQSHKVKNSDGCVTREVDIPWKYITEKPGAFLIEAVPEDKVITPENAGAIDPYAILESEANITYKGRDVERKIDKVLYNGEELPGSPVSRAVIDGYEYDFSKAGVYEIIYRVIYNGADVDEPKVLEDLSFTIVVHNESGNEILNGDFEFGNLSGWTVVSGNMTGDDRTPVISNETYWGNPDMPYNRTGRYHLGGQDGQTLIPESDTWTVRSTKFVLGGSGWISVKMGGNAAAVKVYTAEDNVLVGYYRQTRFKDVDFGNIAVGSWLDMGTYVMDLSGYLGRQMYIELCDEDCSTWRYATFDEVKTFYATKPDWQNERETVTNSAGKTPAQVEIPWTLAENLLGKPEETKKSVVPGLEASVPDFQVKNGSFETGDLTGWEPLTPGFKKDEAVISDETYWGENLPYNQAGNYHLDGWKTGIDEAAGWEVKSSNFTLQGSGYISVRMGGRAAAVKVYLADGNHLVGYYKNKQNIDPEGKFPNVENGSWADMATYVMNLSDYIGLEMYIVLCDEVVEGNWRNAYFDEVVTYYETAPAWENMIDYVYNSAGYTPSIVRIPWKLVESEPISTNSLSDDIEIQDEADTDADADTDVSVDDSTIADEDETETGTETGNGPEDGPGDGPEDGPEDGPGDGSEDGPEDGPGDGSEDGPEDGLEDGPGDESDSESEPIVNE